MPIDPTLAKEFAKPQDGANIWMRFGGAKSDWQPGETKRLRILDVSEDYETQYKIADKKFAYKFTLQEPDGRERLLNIQSPAQFQQMFRHCYPGGLEKGFESCVVDITYRASRKQKQSSMVVAKVEEDAEVPF